MSGAAQHVRMLTCLGATLAALAAGACGSASSGAAKVGDCIDAQRHVVACSSPSATQKLVSDQSAPNAIACVQIGDKPQVEVKVGKVTFCAESK